MQSSFRDAAWAQCIEPSAERKATSSRSTSSDHACTRRMQRLDGQMTLLGQPGALQHHGVRMTKLLLVEEKASFRVLRGRMLPLVWRLRRTALVAVRESTW